MNKDDNNRHFVLLIIDISKHGAKEMGHVKMAGPGFIRLTENLSKPLYTEPLSYMVIL